MRSLLNLYLPRCTSWSERTGACWLLLPLLALWPVWLWSARRLGDGSDDPLGLVALLWLLVALWRARDTLQPSPRLAWLSLALCLAALASLPALGLPALLRAVVAVLAVFCGLLAVRRAQQPVLAWLGLAILALPILSSLQFFAGYPLRLVTAQASAGVLGAFGLDVIRQGTTLEVGGRLVMVDAPCSGIQMAWVAYFTACATATWLGLGDRAFARRLPLLGLMVLGGNILRNTLLVLLESGWFSGPAWAHEAIGLLVFAGVCALVLVYMAGASPGVAPPRVAPAPPVAPATRRAAPRLRAALALGFLGVALLPALRAPAEPVAPAAYVEWPRQFAGRTLRPLALSAVEQRFAEQFPGAIARFTDGQQQLSLRHVTAATRKLHPAADCYRGLGYRIRDIALERRPDDARQGLQRCFVAERRGARIRVCEYIEDARARTFSDTSAWYWAALSGQSEGPWRAVTLARAF
ncbi:MAG: exosortase Q [Pseudomonas sp.]|uniref:exosortase Q n=1 Tax=Pseudomonas sp. TaxID=306 RepID=UPI003397298A